MKCSFTFQLSKGLCGSGQGKVVDVLLDMRRQRMGLIQTHDQLRFSYQAIVYGAHKLVEVNGKVCMSLIICSYVHYILGLVSESESCEIDHQIKYYRLNDMILVTELTHLINVSYWDECQVD